MNEATESTSVLKFALGAVAAVLVLNFILRIGLKLEGVPITIAIAAGLIILLIHYLPYPAFAQMFFSEKYFTKFIQK